MASDGGTTTVAWAIRGAGLDYDEEVVGTEPTAPQATSTGSWWYDGPRGNLKITYTNLLANSTPVITADFTRQGLLSRIITSPTLLRINGVTIDRGYARGSWTAQVSFE